jgi:hypothetical protein
VLEHAEDVSLIFFHLGPLRPMTAVFYLQLVETKALSDFVELKGVRVRDVKPRDIRQRLLGGTHPKGV